MIGQRKPEGMPHKGHSNYHEGVAQRLSPSPPVCLSNMYFFFLLINTVSLLSIFVGILFCKAEGPGPLSLTTGLGARILRFYCLDPASYNWGDRAVTEQGVRTHRPGLEQSGSTPACLTPDLRLHTLGEPGRHGSQLPGEQIHGELSTPRPRAEREASE